MNIATMLNNHTRNDNPIITYKTALERFRANMPHQNLIRSKEDTIALWYDSVKVLHKLYMQLRIPLIVNYVGVYQCRGIIKYVVKYLYLEIVACNYDARIIVDVVNKTWHDPVIQSALRSLAIPVNDLAVLQELSLVFWEILLVDMSKEPIPYDIQIIIEDIFDKVSEDIK